MGLSSKKQTTKIDQNQSENVTTTPNMAPWLSDSFQNYTGQINNFLQQDPNSLVAGPSQLQQQAFQSAANLGPNPLLNQAATAAQNAAGPQTAQTANVAQTGPAQQSQMVQIEAAAQAAAAEAVAKGYTAAQAEQVRLATLERGKAYMAEAQSVLDNGGVQKYVDPSLGQLVDANLANFDDTAGRTQAAYAAQGARNGAFGGSRYAIGEAQLGADLTRGRALTEAELRSNAWQQASNLAMYDTTNRQNVNIRNADARTNVSLQNAAMANQHNQYQSGLQQQTNLANAGFENDARAFSANAQNQASIANANNSTQVSMANAAQQNARNLAAAQMTLNNNQFNASQGNAFALTNANAMNQANMFNASQQNNMSQFNASNALNSASLLANIGNMQSGDARANLALQGELGNQQYEIDQRQRLAQLAQLQAAGQLYSGIPANLFTGQNVVGNTHTTGTNTTKQSGSIFDSILGLAALNPFGLLNGGK